jgi:hypothetical protein
MRDSHLLALAPLGSTLKSLELCTSQRLLLRRHQFSPEGAAALGKMTALERLKSEGGDGQHKQHCEQSILPLQPRNE